MTSQNDDSVNGDGAPSAEPLDYAAPPQTLPAAEDPAFGLKKPVDRSGLYVILAAVLTCLISLIVGVIVGLVHRL